eukprot:scaffold48_cov311-Pinguiococcus_pyrenoidosus.AAC.125
MDGYDFEVPTEFVASRVSETFDELGDATEVRLVRLGLGVKQLQLLCDKLRQHGTKLEKLQLGSNKLGDSGLERLSRQAFPACGELVDLHLGDNRVGKHGLSSFAREGMRCCPNLRRLSLQGNDIDDDAVEVLSEEGLPSCSKLQVVCLHGNKKIGTRGVRALAKAATAHCPDIVTIQIDKLSAKLGMGLDVDRRDADNLAKTRSSTDPRRFAKDHQGHRRAAAHRAARAVHGRPGGGAVAGLEQRAAHQRRDPPQLRQLGRRRDRALR